MKQSSNQSAGRALGLVAAVAITAAVAGAVFAATDNMGPGSGFGWRHAGMMGGGQMMGGRMGAMGPMAGGDTLEFAEQRLASVKSELAITTEQETAWNAYADATRARAGMMSAHRQLMQGAEARALSFEDRIGLMKGGSAQMQALAQATENLYAALTPEQQQKAERLLHGPMGR